MKFRMHIRHHTGEKTFSCTDCDYSSYELHTPEPICDKSFKYFLLVVPICDKSFKCFLFVLAANLNIKYLQIMKKLSDLSVYFDWDYDRNLYYLTWKT